MRKPDTRFMGSAISLAQGHEERRERGGSAQATYRNSVEIELSQAEVYRFALFSALDSCLRATSFLCASLLLIHLSTRAATISFRA